jgi:hypothetical protein
MPEVASLPWKVIVKAWLYQPFVSAPRDGLPPPFKGAVSSYLSVKTLELLWLPAWSTQVPLSATDGSSSPSYVTCVQLWMPDVASAPWKVTVAAWLYQPFLSGCRAAGLACGEVSSY